MSLAFRPTGVFSVAADHCRFVLPRTLRGCRLAIIILLWLLSGTSESVGQTTGEDVLPSRPISIDPAELALGGPAVAVTDERLRELDAWMRDYAAWQKWADRWLNHRQPGKLVPVADRREKPDPPAWLGDACDLLGGDQEFAAACAMLDSWKDNPVDLKTRRTAAAATAQSEAPTKTLWWQRIHLDGLWTSAQSNVSAFALFGSHLTIEVEGRLQIFAVPGILLVSVPGMRGNRELLPATDWGITYRFFNVGRHTVHFNLVQAWVLGNQASLANANPSMTLAGLSLTFNSKPR